MEKHLVIKDFKNGGFSFAYPFFVRYVRSSSLINKFRDLFLILTLAGYTFYYVIL